MKSKMNLGELLKKMQIPQHNETYHGNAEGYVRISHNKVTIETRNGIEKRVSSVIHTEYIAFLGILRDNPDSTFNTLYDIAMRKYGFADHAPSADVHLQMLQFFEKIGVVKIDGEVKSRQMGAFYVFGIPERAGNAKFSLYDERLKSIKVLSVTPKDPHKEKAFYKYFPAN